MYYNPERVQGDYVMSIVKKKIKMVKCDDCRITTSLSESSVEPIPLGWATIDLDSRIWHLCPECSDATFYDVFPWSKKIKPRKRKK